MLSDILSLFTHLSVLRRFQLLFLAVFMLLGGFFEILTVGLLFPFVHILSNPLIIRHYMHLYNIKFFIDFDSDQEIIVVSTIVFSIVIFFSGVLRLTLSYVVLQIGNTIGHDLSTELFKKILSQPYEYHISVNSSETVSTMEICNYLPNNIILPVLQFLVALFIAISLLSGLVFVGMLPGLLIGLFAAGFYILITISSRRFLARASGMILQAQRGRITTVQEASGNIRDVVISGLRKTYLNRFITSDRDLKNARVASGFVGSAPRFAIESVGTILIAVLACSMALRPGGLSRSLPLLATFALGAQKLIPNLQQIFMNWTTILTNQRGLKNVLEKIDLPYADDDDDGVEISFEKNLILDNIIFSYRKDLPPVLNGFSALIPKGARVGVVGKTGAGKTTLVDVIMGLLEPTSGEIRVDGKVIGKEEIKAWRKKISQVPQSVYLSDASIARNISLCDDDADIDWPRLRRSTQMAQIDSFILGLPEQYETIVGERGVRLSGGQRQRIGIARALYRNAEIIVLDEATSALDNETQADLLASLAGIGPDTTIIMIAHRVSTLADCDLILNLG